MQEQELKIAGGSLFYQIQKKGVCIMGCQGSLQNTAGELSIPAQVEGMPVTSIGKKAFLSNKYLRRVVLPDTITEVGDWAFAYCSGLKEVELPRRAISFGKSVFLECEALKFLKIRETGDAGLPPDKAVSSNKEAGNQAQMTAALLASAVTVGEAYYLLDICEAGSREWLLKWDARMLAVIRTSDQEGFSKQILCGEEDYGSTDLNAYMSHRRKVKVRLMLLRLLYSYGLDEDIKEELQAYLKSHTKGCKSEEAWEVVLEEHGEEREYYGLFAELGCVTDDNLDGILRDIGEGCPEMKAYFIRYKEENIGQGDFFGELEL